MEWMILVVLILIGFVLLILEFLVFPGINVAGIIGFTCICFGIYLGYHYFGVPTGHWIVIGSAVGGVAITWYALRANTWKHLSLHSQINSTVEGVDVSVVEGDTGVCQGRLAPMGKVVVRDVVCEAESQSGYIDAHSEVEVVKVFKNKIIVKLKTT